MAFMIIKRLPLIGKQSFKTIDDLIACKGIDAYQNGDLANAKKLFQQAQ